MINILSDIVTFFIVTLFVYEENYDANWKSLHDDNLPHNQINIPGTHDNRAYKVSIIKTAFAQTQKI